MEMEIHTHVVLIEFDTIAEGLNFKHDIAFSVDGKNYNHNGDKLVLDILGSYDIKIYREDKISIEIYYINIVPGELFIKDNILQYYKENYEI